MATSVPIWVGADVVGSRPLRKVIFEEAWGSADIHWRSYTVSLALTWRSVGVGCHVVVSVHLIAQRSSWRGNSFLGLGVKRGLKLGAVVDDLLQGVEDVGKRRPIYNLASCLNASQACAQICKELLRRCHFGA